MIFALLMLGVCVNPAMALRYGFGFFPFAEEKNVRFAKLLQAFNAVVSVLLLVLVAILFEKLSNGYILNW